MKKTFLKLGYVLIALVFFIQAAVSQKSEDVKSKIEKINKEMADAMISGNSEAGLKYYAEDAVSMPHGSEMVVGKESIKKSNEEMMKSGFKIKSFEANTKDIQTYGNMIHEFGEFKISMSMPGMEGEMEEEGKYLTIWEQQADGSLKIKTEIWNSSTMPMEGTGMGMEEGKEIMEERKEIMDNK